MLRFFALLLLVLLCFWLLVPASPRTGTPLVATTDSAAAVAEAPILTAPDFSEIGTLVFYPNNEKPVPYLMYVDANGTTAAKALVFSRLPPADYSSWSGAHVSVTGLIDREHVIVSQISYISPP